MLRALQRRRRNAALGGGGPSDTTAPTVVITSTEESPTSAAVVPIVITFSEDVTGFAVGDITISAGGSLANFTAVSASVYTVNWTPAIGANTMDIAAGVCQDAAGNGNEAATQFPMTITPITANVDCAKDTFVISSLPTRNFGVTAMALNLSNSKMLLGFDLTAIPATATLVSAKLKLYHAQQVAAAAWTITAYAIASGNAAWPEGSKNSVDGVAGDSCWNYLDQDPGNETAWAGSAGLATSGTDYEADALGNVSGDRSDPVGTEYIITLTTARIQAMLGGGGTNYGFLIPAPAHTAGIATRESATAGYRPILEVVYLSPPQTALYVTTTGDDANDGTVAAPLLTIARANTIALVNSNITTINIGAGTYQEQVTVPRSSLAYVSGGEVIIDGQTTRKGIYNIYDTVTFTGSFEIVNCTTALENSGGDDFTASALEIHACSGIGIYLLGGDSPVFSNIEIYDTGGYGIVAIDGVIGMHLSTFNIHDLAVGQTGLEYMDNEGVGVFADGWIWNCRYGYVPKRCVGTQFIRCVAFDNTDSGFYIKGAEDTELINCDSYGNGENGIWAHQDDLSLRNATGLIVSNTIIKNNQRGFYVEETCKTGFTSDYNDIHNNTLGTGIWGSTGCNALADWQAATSGDVNSLEVDPDYATVVKDGFVPQAAAVLAGASDGGAQGYTG